MDTLTLYASAGGSGGGSTKPAYECSTHSRSAINADVMQLEDILFSESRSCGLESHRRHQLEAMMKDKYQSEYSPEEKEFIRADLVAMNKRAAEVAKESSRGLHPRVQELRDRLKNSAPAAETDKAFEADDGWV